jgi:hypothetical protein
MRDKLVLAGVLTVFTVAGAHAQHAGSYTGRRGNTTTWNTDVSHGTATGSVVGPKGYTTSGSATEHYEGGGAYGVSGAVTGPRGTTRSGSTTVVPE